jgi:MbtH protein
VSIAEVDNRKGSAMFEEFPDRIEYKVVINHEEQYSLWPTGRENPLGWKDVGKTGTKKTCLVYIEEVWTDMRPLSVHKEMAARITRRG